METESWRVPTRPDIPISILLDLTQLYKFKVIGTEKTPNSLVTFETNAAMRLVKQYDEEQDDKPNKDGNDGFSGKMDEWRKEVDAKTVEVGLVVFCSVLKKA